MTSPKLTVFIPAFDKPRYLREALQSLCLQRLSPKDYRVVVSDDASPTPLADVVKEFENRLQIKYVKNSHNIGHILNFARAAEFADTEYLSILPHDDVVAPGHFRELMSVLTPEIVFAAGLVVVCRWPGAHDSYVHGTSLLRDDAAGMLSPYRWNSDEWQAASLIDTPFSMVGAIFRSSVFSQCGEWLRYPLWHDRLWCAEMGLRGTVVTVPWVGGFYRVSEDQLSRKLWHSNSGEFQQVSSLILRAAEAQDIDVIEFWVEFLINACPTTRAHFLRQLYRSLHNTDFAKIVSSFQRRSKSRATLGGRIGSLGLPFSMELALRRALRGKHGL